MTRQAIYHLIFNSLGLLVGLTIAGYIVYSLVHTEREPPCSARYPAPMRFSLHTAAGAPMSPIELQARVGLNEWGVHENAKVVAVAEAPGGAALEVTLADVAEVETANGRPANGVSFRWTPPGVRTATAACLSYSVWLPEDFAFAGGGLLPGPFGGGPATSETAERFAERLEWSAEGTGTLFVAPAGSRYAPINLPGTPLPKGRWINVEQEMVLNTPDASDGVVRLWIDGALQAESKGLALRKDNGAAIVGVEADIGYIRSPEKPGTLRVSPFELSWK